MTTKLSPSVIRNAGSPEHIHDDKSCGCRYSSVRGSDTGLSQNLRWFSHGDGAEQGIASTLRNKLE